MFRSPIADGVIVLLVLLLFFGPKRLPMLSRSIGESIKEFKGGIDHDGSSDKDKAEITDATPAPSAAPRETVDTGSEHRS
jgi:sec-independent protein translocase protein TatA